jgi:transcriptional regulator with XRE-family HTH domain
MVIIGNRLREERTRLGLTQDQFAEKAGVTKRSLVNYEKGERSPDASFLSAIAEAGADVLYVLTGVRSQGAQEEQLLPPRERALIDNYRACDDDGKRVIEGAARLGSQSKAA